MPKKDSYILLWGHFCTQGGVTLYVQGFELREVNLLGMVDRYTDLCSPVVMPFPDPGDP